MTYANGIMISVIALLTLLIPTVLMIKDGVTNMDDAIRWLMQLSLERIQMFNRMIPCAIGLMIMGVVISMMSVLY